MDWKEIEKKEGERPVGSKKQGSLGAETVVLRMFPECHLVAKGREKGTEAERWVLGVHKYPQLQTCAAYNIQDDNHCLSGKPNVTQCLQEE